MRCLNRNKQPFYYCLFDEKIPIVDEYGNESGESIVTYHEPVMEYANISQATGQSNTEIFGNLESYDKVIVLNRDTPIDENSVLFIDKEPEFTNALTHTATAVTTLDEEISVPLYDYTVKRVARSLNSTSIAVKKVDVT